MKISLRSFCHRPRFWLLLLMAAAMALAVLFGLGHPSGYTVRERGSLTYCEARVERVRSENVARNREGIARGTQTLTVVPTESKYKGRTLTFKNVLNYEHSIYLRQGERFIACIDASPSGTLLVTAYSYRRGPTILIVALIFLAVLTAVCGKKGLFAAAGLLFSFILLVFVNIPLISIGVEPVLSTLLVLLPVLAVSCLLLLGFTWKAAVSFLSSFAGMLLSAALFFVIGGALHVSGYNLDDIETLVVVAQKTPVHIRNLLFSGVLIASLGGILDVAVSVVSSVAEVYAANTSLSRGELFRVGFRVGRDVTCSTANTLILAFVGNFFVSLFLYHIYGVGFTQIVNFDSVGIEFASALSGTAALTLAAPLTALLASRFISGGAVRARKRLKA